MKKISSKFDELFLKNSNIAVILLSLLIVVFHTPIISRNLPNVVIIGLMFLFVVSVIKFFKGFSKTEIATLILLGTYFLLEVMYKFSGVSSAELYYYFNTVQFFFFLAAGMALRTFITKRQTIYLLCVSVAIMFITLLSNILLYLQYGAKEYVSLFNTHRYSTNSVNTQFVFAVLLMAGMSFIYFLKGNNKKLKTLSLISVLFLSFFIVVISQRMIALILMILMYLLLLVASIGIPWYKKLERRKKRILIIAVISVLLLIVILYKPILLLVCDMIGSDRIEKRIRQIITLFETGNLALVGGSLAARIELGITSVKTFFSSPETFLFGIGDHRITNLFIGNHSQFIDAFARYGICGAAIIFALFWGAVKSVKGFADIKKADSLNLMINIILFIFILRGFVGNIFDASIGIGIFIIVPLFFRFLKDEIANQNN